MEPEPNLNERLDLVQALAQTPDHWLERLLTGATCVDSRLVLQIIDELPADQAELAQGLSLLVESFQFEEILGLLQKMPKYSSQE